MDAVSVSSAFSKRTFANQASSGCVYGLLVVSMAF